MSDQLEKRNRVELKQDLLKALLNYDPLTGEFTWRVDMGRNRKAGDRAGLVRKDGYVQVSFNGSMYLAHRLAWMYVHGKFPENDTDHINRNRADNRIANLREATRSENLQNRGQFRSKQLGFRGTYFHKRRNKWYSQIMARGERKFLGYHDTEELASKAYEEARLELHTFNHEVRL